MKKTSIKCKILSLRGIVLFEGGVHDYCIETEVRTRPLDNYTTVSEPTGRYSFVLHVTGTYPRGWKKLLKYNNAGLTIEIGRTVCKSVTITSVGLSPVWHTLRGTFWSKKGLISAAKSG